MTAVRPGDPPATPQPPATPAGAGRVEAPRPTNAPRARLHVWPWLRRTGGLLLPGWLAITIGRDIWSWRPLGPAELAHELTHVRQWREHGVLYAVRYAASSWGAWRGGGHWYRDNAFEVEARAAAEAVTRTTPPPAI